MSYRTESLTRKKLEILKEMGIYKDEEEFIEEAINSLLAVRKDLRIEMACELYKRSEISLGKACEIVNVDIEEMKEILKKRNIRRNENASSKEMNEMTKEVLKIMEK